MSAMLLALEKPLIYQVSSTENDKHCKHLKSTHPVVLSSGYGTTETLIDTISEMIEWLFLFLFEARHINAPFLHIVPFLLHLAVHSDKKIRGSAYLTFNSFLYSFRSNFMNPIFSTIKTSCSKRLIECFDACSSIKFG